MTIIIDRRNDDSRKNTTNRQKFHRKVKKALKEALDEGILSRKIEDAKHQQKVKVKSSILNEPSFIYDMDNDWDTILPGNDRFKKGDTIPKPYKGSKKGSNAGKGEGEDSFSFILSAEEFINLLFEDCELPDLIKTSLDDTEVYETKFLGYSNYGNPSSISIIKSFQNALVRHLAWTSAIDEEIEILEKYLTKLAKNSKKTPYFEQKLQELKALKTDIPYMDEIDLRYRHYDRVKVPAVTAVMFCVMDVSGSMDEQMKSLAKKFFILLHLFLKQNYEKVQIVFIRHTDYAKEVSEEAFFIERESGGTVISSALELVNKIIDDRFNSTTYNIYIAQASDGDNVSDDNHPCYKIITQELLPKVQYMCYIQINGATSYFHGGSTRYYKLCDDVSKAYKNFATAIVEHSNQIYQVFKKLFEKKYA